MYDPTHPPAANIRFVKPASQSTNSNIVKPENYELNNPKILNLQEIGNNRKLLREYKEQIKLTTFEKEVVIGNVLGDASLQTQNNGKTYRLKFQYSSKNKDYALFVFKRYKRWCISNPVESPPQINSTTGEIKRHGSITFQTISHSEFKTIADLFKMQTGKKGITPNLVRNHLSDMGLAFWFMDDGGKMDYGSNEGKGITLNTQCFTKDEVDLLCDELSEKFNFNCWPKKNKNGYVISISGKSYENFVGRVMPYLEESMKTKIPSPRKTIKYFLPSSPSL